MWSGIFILLSVVVTWFLIERFRPFTCPHCRKINIFWRKKTGRSIDDKDSEGDLIRNSEEAICGRCGHVYWLIWDDFDGCWASKELQRRQ